MRLFKFSDRKSGMKSSNGQRSDKIAVVLGKPRCYLKPPMGKDLTSSVTPMSNYVRHRVGLCECVGSCEIGPDAFGDAVEPWRPL